jgi:hypothetical protein
MNKIIIIFALVVFPSIAHGGTIDEVGIADLNCTVRRVDDGLGVISDRILCRYSTYDSSGATVRRGVSRTLSNLTMDEAAKIQECVQVAWGSIYGREGFPLPTPRPTPQPTPIP